MIRPQKLYKYMTAQTGRIVLNSLSLRWSSPELFNDPFDVPRELAQGVPPQDIQIGVFKSFAELIKSSKPIPVHLDPRIVSFIESERKKGNGIEIDKICNELTSYVPESSTMYPAFDELRNMWRELIPNLRILCLTERIDNTVMWAHYAENSKGIALGFTANKEVDSALLEAKKVNYISEGKVPLFLSNEGWGNLIVNMSDPIEAISKVFEEYCYTKTKNWEYEREWRISTPKKPLDQGQYSDWHFAIEELDSIYIGHKADDKLLSHIIDLNYHLLGVKIFKCEIDGQTLKFKPFS